MKQIILGMFGMVLMLGTLLAEWNIYSLTVGRTDVKQSVRSIEILLKQRGDENLEEAELRCWIERELNERYQNAKVQYEVKLCDMEQRRLQICIKKEIPYFSEFPKKIVIEKLFTW